MVKVVCGLIGSGKTTYAIKNKNSNDILLDWDLLVEALKTENLTFIKEVQDMLLKFFTQKEFKVWYITTRLGSNELSLLNQIKDVEYIWINTTRKQCLENIKKRNRGEEIKHLEDLDNINRKIQETYTNESEIKYKIVNIFENNERW